MPIELHSSVCPLSHVYLLRERPGLPFSDTLDPDLVTEALEREAVSSRERVCAPLVTLRTFSADFRGVATCLIDTQLCMTTRVSIQYYIR